MKLLLDHHLSHKLLHSLKDLFPDSCHVYQVGLDKAHDIEILDYARQYDYIILTKDADFQDLNLFTKPQVKVIWLRIGNSDNQTVASKIISNFDEISLFNQDKLMFTMNYSKLL